MRLQFFSKGSVLLLAGGVLLGCEGGKFTNVDDIKAKINDMLNPKTENTQTQQQRVASAAASKDYYCRKAQEREQQRASEEARQDMIRSRSPHGARNTLPAANSSASESCTGSAGQKNAAREVSTSKDPGEQVMIAEKDLIANATDPKQHADVCQWHRTTTQFLASIFNGVGSERSISVYYRFEPVPGNTGLYRIAYTGNDPAGNPFGITQKVGKISPPTAAFVQRSFEMANYLNVREADPRNRNDEDYRGILNLPSTVNRHNTLSVMRGPVQNIGAFPPDTDSQCQDVESVFYSGKLRQVLQQVLNQLPKDPPDLPRSEPGTAVCKRTNVPCPTEDPEVGSLRNQLQLEQARIAKLPSEVQAAVRPKLEEIERAFEAYLVAHDERKLLERERLQRHAATARKPVNNVSKQDVEMMILLLRVGNLPLALREDNDVRALSSKDPVERVQADCSLHTRRTDRDLLECLARWAQGWDIKSEHGDTSVPQYPYYRADTAPKDDKEKR